MESDASDSEVEREDEAGWVENEDEAGGVESEHTRDYSEDEAGGMEIEDEAGGVDPSNDGITLQSDVIDPSTVTPELTFSADSTSGNASPSNACDNPELGDTSSATGYFCDWRFSGKSQE